MKKLKTFFLLAFLLNISFVHGQEDKFKALFMYNFTKYLEWPASQRSGDFVVEVLGASGIVAELEIIAQKRKVGAQSIIVRRISDINESLAGNILFIPEQKSTRITQAVEQLKGKGTLIITDKPGLCKQGACINYVKINGKQNFEVSKTNIERQGLKVNATLLSLGITVD